MFRKFMSAAVSAAFFLAAAAAAMAQDVTLTSRDGGLEVHGRLLTFDGEFYRVDTIYGELLLDGQAVTCEGPGCPDLEAYVSQLTFSGARDIGAVLLPALIESFAARRGLKIRREAQNPDHLVLELLRRPDEQVAARMTFHLTTTSEGFADLLAGEADIVMALREVQPDEVARGLEAGLGRLSDPRRNRIVALDALVPLVSASNPLREISVDDLVAMLAGQVTLWPGREDPVHLNGYAPGLGMDQMVNTRLLRPAGQVAAQPRRSHDSVKALARAVATDPFALGIGRMSQTDNARILRISGTCGMSPRLDRQTLKAEDYPFAAPMFLYTPARRLPVMAREFLDFLETPAAQIVVRRLGYVDQLREQIPMAEQGERLAKAIALAGPETPLSELQRMVSSLGDAVRLTTSFRFRGGSAALDAQSARNVAGLARALESGAFDGRELMFVGFSDGEGSAAVNRKISMQRAQAVQHAVKTQALSADFSRLQLSVLAFGEAMPMACDDSEWGRSVNRRVEVWLR